MKISDTAIWSTFWVRNKLFKAIIIAASVEVILSSCLPPHPSKISYPPLDWKVPSGSPYRLTLSNGLKAYIAEDHAFPLIELVAYIRSAAFFDPVNKEGLGSLTARLMRTGGTRSFPADTLDKILDLHAIRLSITLSETELVCRLSCLSEHADIALKILSEVLFFPAFEQAKVNQEKQIAVEMVRHRFDNPEPLLAAAYAKAMYRSMPNSRLATEQSILSITHDDLVRWHSQTVATQNIFLAAAGNFRLSSFVASLERLFPAATGSSAAEITNTITPASTVRCLIAHRPLTQAYVRFGIPLFKRPHPDYYALSALNIILGNAGFTSRLGKKIRSDEGLTYSIHSTVESNYVYPATFFVSFHTKTETVVRATWMALAEVERIRQEGITESELAQAKRMLIDALPSMFRSPADIVQTYAWNEYYGRSADHFVKYADSINALSVEDVNRVAKQYLDTSKFIYTVIGDTTDILGTEPFNGFSFRRFSSLQTWPADSLPLLDQPRHTFSINLDGPSSSSKGKKAPAARR